MSKADKRERQRENRDRAREERARLMKRDKVKRSIIRLLVMLLIVGVAYGAFTFFTSNDDSADNEAAGKCSSTTPTTTAKNTEQQIPPMTVDPAKKYSATMVTSCGTIEIALDAKAAPQSVNAFVALSREGFYDGTLFHRIVKDFVDQGGDPSGDGTGGPGFVLPDEPPADGYKVGSVALANSGTGTSGSQFFIATSKTGAEKLGTGGPPYKYSILGQVTNGMDVVELINSFGTVGEAGTPTKKIYTTKVTITES
ncbi:MAG: peptidylprolyl isomerase [Acidimicrobiia bacterium]|nr:peptidylprolyl isomerase [Acidimicrobiia bacterium]